MNCVVTAGPTYEPLDEVRRLTNFSTGRLGVGLTNYLTLRGHRVVLLLGEQAISGLRPKARQVATFSTTADLRARLEALAGAEVQAVFHAAAVSDFAFGKVWRRQRNGNLCETKAGKLPTGQGPLLAELVPTGKLIRELRGWFPRAWITGWKYEVAGDRLRAIALAEKQIVENQTNACVVNGRGYGEGFGLVTQDQPCVHLAGAQALYRALEERL
jgi:phosphopantothenoylcysteine decarboxylase/phosphopantothenate--cysteine ligase